MSVYTGESRGELIAWLNTLLVPYQVTKLEECGTGSIYCQVVDSIYGDLPMSKVKFNARAEYEYLDNFKVLQGAFKRHQVDKPIPVERLIKCKMQDNLEFLQWLKKFWDTNSRGEDYNAQGRAGGQLPSAPSTSRAPMNSRTASAASRAPAARTAVPSAGSRVASTASNAKIVELQNQLAETTDLAAGVQNERDFYFEKLRQIEIIVQQRSTVEGIDAGEKAVLSQIQEILYDTTEGFELPDQQAAEHHDDLPPDDEETF